MVPLLAITAYRSLLGGGLRVLDNRMRAIDQDLSGTTGDGCSIRLTNHGFGFMRTLISDLF